MKTKVMETSITSETVSQNTISGEVEEAIKDIIPEIAKRSQGCLTKIRSKLMIGEVLKKEIMTLNKQVKI